MNSLETEKDPKWSELTTRLQGKMNDNEPRAVGATRDHLKEMVGFIRSVFMYLSRFLKI